MKDVWGSSTVERGNNLGALKCNCDDDDDNDEGIDIIGEGGIEVKRFAAKLLNALIERCFNGWTELTPQRKGNVRRCEPANLIFEKFYPFEKIIFVTGTKIFKIPLIQ